MTEKIKYPRGWYSIIARKLEMDRGTVRRQLLTQSESPDVARELQKLLKQKQNLDQLKSNYKPIN